MRIKDVMTQPAVTCRKDMHLDAVVRLMAEYDCDLVPVVDAFGRLTGVLTDRDVCLAALKHGTALNQIPVAGLMAKQVFSCRADDLVESAASLMRDLHVTRLTVTDGAGNPIGTVSLDDITRMTTRMMRRQLRAIA